MAQTTGISWCDHSWNPWLGCAQVSPGCAHCYAKDMAEKRMKLNVWDDKAVKPRKITADSTWKQPLAWNRKAERDGVRRRVFCASMADVFEYRSDLIEPRKRLWDLIANTPYLDWLILTKRPENVLLLCSLDWHEYGFPDNVWIGTSVENQHFADIRIPQLLQIPAKVRFLSCEPLLAEVNLVEYITPNPVQGAVTHHNRTNHLCSGAGDGAECDECDMEWDNGTCGIHWVIAGGESGPKHRPVNIDWLRLLRDQCAAAHVPYFMKQIGGKTSKSGGDLLDGRQYHEWPRGNAA